MEIIRELSLPNVHIIFISRYYLILSFGIPKENVVKHYKIYHKILDIITQSYYNL